MKKLNKIWAYFEAKPFWQYLLLLVLALFLFGFLQASPTFPDPDSFYHAKLAGLMARSGVVTELPWLSATNLKVSFVDHHFLYHILLVPFVVLLNPLVGIKILSVILASLLVLTFFWFLRQFKVSGAMWYALLLITINPFIFRLNLAKAPALVLILFFLIVAFLVYRRYLGLVLCSFIYVWLYGGWPTAIGLAGIYFLLSLVWPANWRGSVASGMGKIRIARQSALSLSGVMIGVLAGIVFSPYFPENLKFYWQQTFQIAIVNYQSLINVGGEWYPYTFNDLVLAAIPFFIFLALALVLFLFNLRKQPLINWYMLILAAVFFALTLKSRRYVEYFIPLALAFTALSITTGLPALRKFFTPVLDLKYQKLIPWVILLALFPIFYTDIATVKAQFADSIPFTKFAAAAGWLEKNSEPGDVVLHSDWDEFPLLFYHNDTNYYLVGLDPTFMYQANAGMYRIWTRITAGEAVEDMKLTVGRLFGACYVFVDYHQNEAMDRLFATDINFEKVYQDQEARIYELKK